MLVAMLLFVADIHGRLSIVLNLCPLVELKSLLPTEKSTVTSSSFEYKRFPIFKALCLIVYEFKL